MEKQTREMSLVKKNMLLVTLMAIVFLATGIIVSISMYNKKKLNVDPFASEITDTLQDGVLIGEPNEEGVVSAGYGSTVNEKAMAKQRIAYKCPSFMGRGEKLIVDVAVGDYSYSYNQQNGLEPSYDTYGVHGYPLLQVYLCNPNNCELKYADGNLLVNNVLNEYRRVFTKDEMAQIDLNHEQDVSCGKHENIELDFSNYEVESKGEIAFCFSWSFGEQANHETNWKIHRQFLFFYVGEQGIGLGGAPELAEENYYKAIGCNKVQKDCGCAGIVDWEENYTSGSSDYLEGYDREGIGEGESVDEEDTLYTRATYTVSGYIKWTDKAGNNHPANGVTVQIWKGTVSSPSFTLINTLTTSATGYYSSSYSYEGSVALLKIKVLSSGTNINVVDASGLIYTNESGISGGTSNITINVTADNNSFPGRSVSVHQGMALANRYMYNLKGSYMNTIDVEFASSVNRTCYSYSPSMIHIIYKDAYDWDVLEHEFGHYVQDVYDINDSPASPPGGHLAEDNLADIMGNKSNGIHLAWGEGWATYFAINLQRVMGASSLGVPNVGDALYQDTEDLTITYDIENLETDLRKGEANEATVSAILYDITDPINTSEDDQININNGTVWSITKNNNCTTLSEFINAFNSYLYISKGDKVKLGSTLSRYSVSANLVSLSHTGNTVTFTWEKQGGSINYGNNSFRLVFYDDSYNLLYMTSYSNGTSQSISLSQWNSLFSNAPSAVYSCVQTRQTSSPTTGPYYSNVITTWFIK